MPNRATSLCRLAFNGGGNHMSQRKRTSISTGPSPNTTVLSGESNPTANTRNNATNCPTLAVYVVGPAGIFEDRYGEILGLYQSTQDAEQCFLEALVPAQIMIPPVHINTLIYEVLALIHDHVVDIASGNTLSVDYLFPYPRDNDAALIGICRRPTVDDIGTGVTGIVKIRGGKVINDTETQCAGKFSFMKGLFTEVDRV